jgi:hypothetical protein
VTLSSRYHAGPGSRYHNYPLRITLSCTLFEVAFGVPVYSDFNKWRKLMWRQSRHEMVQIATQFTVYGSDEYIVYRKWRCPFKENNSRNLYLELRFVPLRKHTVASLHVKIFFWRTCYCHMFPWLRRGFGLVNRFIGSSLVVITISSYTLKITVIIIYVTSHTKSSNYSSGYTAVSLELRNSNEVSFHSRMGTARTTHRKHSSIVE